jgi:pimeloyl-ACP methyl ester carboxylesterase
MRCFKRHILTTSDADIACVDTGGDGTPLVLLHGSGASKHVFCPQFSDPSLLEYRLIALDLPGHGNSSDALDSSTYTHSGMGRAIGTALDMLGVNNPVMAGWALGGSVAIELAASGRGARGLVLFGTPPLPRGPFGFFRAFQPKLDMLLSVKERFSEREAERFAHLIYGPSPDRRGLAAVLRADGLCRARIAKALFHGEGRDQRRFVENTDIPVAIFNGANDPLLRPHYFDDLSFHSLWRGKCQTIANAGHACFRDQPAAFSALLSAFLADVAMRPLRFGEPAVEIAA